MKQRPVILYALVLIVLLFSGVAATVQAAPDLAADAANLQSLPGYNYQAGLQVTNNAAEALPTGYTVNFTINTAGLIGTGRMQTDCDDLRITFNGGTEVELDRLVSGCNTTATSVQFRTQGSIAGSPTTDTRYTLYYGNSSADAPPQNTANVFAFYDNFEDGNATGWTPKGTWNVVQDAFSNYVYRYTDGGAIWALTSTPFAQSNVDLKAKVRGVVSTSWIGLAFRIQDNANFLSFYQSRDVNQFKLARIVGDNHTIPVNPSFTMNANTWYWIRLQAQGSQVRARIWLDGAAEPVEWLISTTESTFLANQNIGLTLHNHNTTADWDEVSARYMASAEPTVSFGDSSWWDNAWNYRRQISLTNTSSTSTLPARFTTSFILDTAALIGSGQMLANCDDLRVVFDPGLAAQPLDRLVQGCNTDHTTVWFALQRPVSPSGQNTAYYLYYGNSLAAAPPANGMNVFLFYEDWEQGQTHWINAGGLDPAATGVMGNTTISTSTAHSPNHSQSFPTRASGGDAFSGYIPVLPSTTYSFSVWGSTPSSNISVPVGYDPYTSAYGRGLENWFWYDLWPIGSTWQNRTATFTTAASTAYIKIKSELWNDPGFPGAPPAYLDDLTLRFATGSEPALTLGSEEGGTVPAPVINAISASSPVALGSAADVSAAVSTSDGTIVSAALKIVSPQTLDVPMTLISGSNTSGSWQATSFVPAVGGVYSYRILAVGSNGRSKLSEQHTFTVSDGESPVITLTSITDPIVVRNTQTLTVQVTDNGQLNSVTLTVGGVTYPMTANDSLYSYSWQVTTVGTILYTVTATDSSSNSATLNNSFVSQARNVEVCTWAGCRKGAASWSIDDGNNSCRAELEAAGIRGTYYVGGNNPLPWYASYSAVGHEIGSHTVGHPCDPPACFPTCTPEALAALPVVPSVVTDYRGDQIEPNIAAIEESTLKPVVSLAWPCGCTDPSRMQAASFSVVGARGYYDHMAQLTWVQDINSITPSNFMLLNTANSYDQTFIDRAYTEGKWATVTSHGSCAGIDYMGQQNTDGKLWVAPIGDVLKYVKVRDASQFSNYSRVGRTISFTASHNLATFTRQRVLGDDFLPIVFDNPVTLKVHILDTDTVLGVTVAGTAVPFAIHNLDGARYVTFDAALNNADRAVEVTLGAQPPVIHAASSAANVELGSASLVTTHVTVSEGALSSVTLNLIFPEAENYLMTREGTTDNYTASFTPAQLGTYSFRIVAVNDQGTATQSNITTFNVRDTTSPQSQEQSQSTNSIILNTPITLSAQGRDIGGLTRAILSTNESGVWQDFDWPLTDWWDHDWQRRRPVTITESAGLARTNELVDLTITSATFTGLTSCVNELRVADASKVELPSQVYGEQELGGVRICHLVFPASVNANASSIYYVYYGNPSATAPAYATDLNVTSTGNVRTIGNTAWNLDLDTSSGIISRLRLPQGSNVNLPVTNLNSIYAGWHQVCATLDGNITGKNNLCQGGAADATGLTMVETLNGPLLREYTFTSVKSNATYTVIYRFSAYAPHYQYILARTGAATSVMNNFWYQNGSYDRLGIGTGSSFNTYDFGSDHVRIFSSATVDIGRIDGTNNDGTQLGATDYQFPSASGLNLAVVTGADQLAAQSVLARIQAPLAAGLFGNAETAPVGQYGSPIELAPGTNWTPTAFTWQHATLDNVVIQWRIRYCDLSKNCSDTPIMSFEIGSPTAVNLTSFRADKDTKGVLLRWETASEVSTIGFNLYRMGPYGSYVRLNDKLIPPQNSGRMEGALYSYVDTRALPGLLYEYKIEVVQTDTQPGDTLHVIYWPNIVHIPFIIR